MPAPRIDEATGRDALRRWAADPEQAGRAVTATAVRWSVHRLAEVAPGSAVEVRVPPFAVTQCIQGPRHTRGTPPAVVETDPASWLELVTGTLSWEQGTATGRVRASGRRTDLAPWLPQLGLGAAPATGDR